MKQTESVKTLLECLANAQAEFVSLPKDKNGYNYKYTDLDTVISTVKPILAKHKLGFMQSLTTLENGKWGITTRVFAAAGEWIEDTTPLPDVSLAKGNAAQNVGAAITYMKRYTLCAMLGISSDEDPDGNVDYNARKNQSEKPEAKKSNVGYAGGFDTPEQRERIINLAKTLMPDGSPMFSTEEKRAFTSMRVQKTADEVIKILNEEVHARLKEWNESRENALSNEEESAAAAVFNGTKQEVVF